MLQYIIFYIRTFAMFITYSINNILLHKALYLLTVGTTFVDSNTKYTIGLSYNS